MVRMRAIKASRPAEHCQLERMPQVGMAGGRVTDRRLRHFAHRLSTRHLLGIALVRDKLKVVLRQAATPPEAQALDRRLDALLLRV